MFKKTIPVITIIALICSCKKKPVQTAEIPAKKVVQFTIAQGNDYSSTIYNGLRAELKLSVAKESILNGSIVAVWDTTFNLRSIRDYALPTSPLIIIKEVNGLVQAKEGLRVSRVIRYATAADQISQNAQGESIMPSVYLKQVLIGL